MKPFDDRFNRRLRARLRSRPDAVRAIEAQLGIDQGIVERFRMGLSQPYWKTSSGVRQLIHQDAMVTPILGEDGSFYGRYVYHCLAGVTIDNRMDTAWQGSWTVGASETFFSRKSKPDDSVIVCDDVRDLWALVALIQDSALDKNHIVIAPSLSKVWPETWKAQQFWKRWKRINIAIAATTANDEHGGVERDQRARQLGAMSGRDVHRFLPLEKTSWLAARLDGLRHDVFCQLLRDAVVLSAADLRRGDGARYGSAAGQDLSCAYYGGYLYEALQVLETEAIDGLRTERLRTIVVRSDRTRHVAMEMPAPPNTPKEERVFRLGDDGTLLHRLPVASSDSTWRWPSAHAFIYEGAVAPPLEVLLRKINSHLKASVWLPFNGDYLLLACIVTATYCQQIFDAVPLILLTGPKGSGKTELSGAICQLAANSSGPIGLISAATLTRLVDTSHGFVAIDDLERVMSTRSNDPNFTDLVQALKLSYKKSSAHRMVTDTNKNNTLQRLNFYGIKLINNTRGVDEILGSRMLTISTRVMPASHILPRDGKLTGEQRAELRDHLHVWAFSHVDDIARAYASIFPDVSTRDAEIFAPLRVIAHLSGSASLIREVDDAIEVPRMSGTMTATEAMEDALLSIVTKSIATQRRLPTVATVLETQMRLQLQQGRHPSGANPSMPSDIDSPEWIGRQFKDRFAPVRAEPVRLELHSRATRFYPLSSELLNKALTLMNVKREDVAEDSNPRAFCASCSACDYQEICDMRPRKLRADARAGLGARRAPASAEKSGNGEAGLH